MENEIDIPLPCSNFQPFLNRFLLPTDGHYTIFYSDENIITLLQLDTFQIYRLSLNELEFKSNDCEDTDTRVRSKLVDCVDAAIASDVLIVGSHSHPLSGTLSSITYYKINLELQTITEEENGPIIPKLYHSWEISALKMESDYLMVSMNDRMSENTLDPVILLWKKNELNSEPWKILKSKAGSLNSTLKQYKDMYSDGSSITALEYCGKIFRWNEIQSYTDSEPEEVVDVTNSYRSGWAAGVDTFRVNAQGQTLVWDFMWCANIMVTEDLKITLQRDPSSTDDKGWEDYEPDYTVRIDPACQFKAVIANDSRNIRLRRILDKHDEPASNNEIDIPVLNTVELGLGKFKDAFLHRQLTGPDKGALYIIYIASDGFYKQKIPKIPVYPLQIGDIIRPCTRYIAYHWGKHQDSLYKKVEASYHDKDPANVELLTRIRLLQHDDAISQLNEIKRKTKTEWDAATLKTLFLEICQQPRAGQIPDIETSICGNLKWEEMEPFDEYEPAAKSEAQVYAWELHGFLLGWNRTREIFYDYKGESVNREIFDEATVNPLESCSDFRELLEAVQGLSSRLQDTRGYRAE